MKTLVGILFVSFSALSTYQVVDKPVIKSQTEKITKYYSNRSESYLTNKKIYSEKGELLEEILYSHSGLDGNVIKKRNLYTYDSLGREISRKTFYKSNLVARSLRTSEYGNRIGGGTYEKTNSYGLDSLERVVDSFMNTVTYFNQQGNEVANKVFSIDDVNHSYSSLRVYNFDKKGNPIDVWFHWDESTFIQKMYESQFDDEGKIISRKGLYVRCGFDLVMEKWKYNPEGRLSYRMTENANGYISHIYYSYNSSGQISEQIHRYGDQEKFLKAERYFYNPYYPEKLVRKETYRDENMAVLEELQEISFTYFEKLN